MRQVDLTRNTNETNIELSLNLDGVGKYDCKTGSGFLDHMLELFALHGRFDLSIRCQGDLHVDLHHTVEDLGIVLGEAFATALLDKRGIMRYASILMPMDEALMQIAIDLSGRAFLSYNVCIPSQKVGDFDTELVEEFMRGFVRSSKFTIHLTKLAGSNSHHIIEALFKGLARTIKQAVSINEAYSSELPSTKGLL